MDIAIGLIIFVLNLFCVFYQMKIRINNRKEIIKWQSDQLKYQKHLRNTYDYLGLMQKAMGEGDEVTFIACSQLVSEELGKCTEIISD